MKVPTWQAAGPGQGGGGGKTSGYWRVHLGHRVPGRGPPDPLFFTGRSSGRREPVRSARAAFVGTPSTRDALMRNLRCNSRPPCRLPGPWRPGGSRAWPRIRRVPAGPGDPQGMSTSDAIAKGRGMPSEERLLWHQAQSEPGWPSSRRMETQITQRKVEPQQCGGGEAIAAYLRKHWDKLTLFLRVPWFLDNKRPGECVLEGHLHSDAYFYKTQNCGAWETCS